MVVTQLSAYVSTAGAEGSYIDSTRMAGIRIDCNGSIMAGKAEF